VIEGCRGSEFRLKRKPLELRSDMQVVVQTRRVHTRAILLVAHIHTHVTLLTGCLPVDRLIYVEDCCLISVGVECVS
jgi:hypothetical protein